MQTISDEQLADEYRKPLLLCLFLGVKPEDVADNLMYPQGYGRKPPVMGPTTFDHVMCYLVTRYRHALANHFSVKTLQYGGLRGRVG